MATGGHFMSFISLRLFGLFKHEKCSPEKFTILSYDTLELNERYEMKPFHKQNQVPHKSHLPPLVNHFASIAKFPKNRQDVLNQRLLAGRATATSIAWSKEEAKKKVTQMP